MIFRPDRRRRGEDPMLGFKMLFFVVGALLGIAGIATDRIWLIYLSIAVLVAGVMLRFVRRGGEPHEEAGDPDD